MNELTTGWLSTQGFMPHGHCYLWTPALLWSFVIADSIIVLSYYSIPFGLLYFVEKRKDLQFNWMFVLFSGFIFACGTTHLISIWTIWEPDYWLDAGVKVATALVSVVTAILLWPLIPKALKFPSNRQLQDVIARLEREVQQRKEAEAQLSQVNRTLENRTSQLEETNKELEAFSYSVSHDLRAPLRGIDGWSLALAEDYSSRLDETGRRHLDVIRFEARRMEQLIDSLLQLSRAGRTPITHEPLDLSAMAQTVAGRLKQEQPGRQAEFVIQPGMSATGDAHLIEIVLTNLLGNACKFTSNRPVARIEFGSMTGADPESKLPRRIFFMRDTGVGFDMAYAATLFGAFRRLHKTSEYPGTGIGLATVQRILHRHDGRIWAEAKVDQGACFYFTIGEAA